MNGESVGHSAGGDSVLYAEINNLSKWLKPVLIALVFYACNFLIKIGPDTNNISLSLPFFGRLLMLYGLSKIGKNVLGWPFYVFCGIAAISTCFDLAWMVGFKPYYHLSFAAVELILVALMLKNTVHKYPTYRKLRNIAAGIFRFLFMIFLVMTFFAIDNVIMNCEFIPVPPDFRDAMLFVVGKPYHYFSSALIMSVALIYLVYRMRKMSPPMPGFESPPDEQADNDSAEEPSEISKEDIEKQRQASALMTWGFAFITPMLVFDYYCIRSQIGFFPDALPISTEKNPLIAAMVLICGLSFFIAIALLISASIMKAKNVKEWLFPWFYNKPQDKKVYRPFKYLLFVLAGFECLLWIINLIEWLLA